MSDGHHGHAHGQMPGAASSAATVSDPVCGMEVDPASALAHEHGGQKFFFCGKRCLDKFTANPAQYIGNAPAGPRQPAAARQPLSGATIWTCPMHPEIRRDGPGACPICGMALEPLDAVGATRARTSSSPT